VNGGGGVAGQECSGTPDPDPSHLHWNKLSWSPPNVGSSQLLPTNGYSVWRYRVLENGTPNGTITPGSQVLVGTTSATTLLDAEDLPDGLRFRYCASASFVGGSQSSCSDFATITAVNAAPVAYADTYSVNAGTSLSVPARGVLVNDTDVDSAATSLVAVLDAGPLHGTLTLNADGSFIYTPVAGFAGTDTFTYRTNDGKWSRDPSVSMSRDSNVATVSITIRSVDYAVAIDPLKSPAQQGSAVPIVWQLKDGSGTLISSLDTLLRMESVFNGSAPPGGCVSSESGTREALYSLPSGATGNSSFRFVESSRSYKFNWDTTTTTTPPVLTGKGCYTVLIYLKDRGLSNPRRTTPVQLK
jgi:VCBS repeat-containing protein